MITELKRFLIDKEYFSLIFVLLGFLWSVCFFSDSEAAEAQTVFVCTSGEVSNGDAFGECSGNAVSSDSVVTPSYLGVCAGAVGAPEGSWSACSSYGGSFQWWVSNELPVDALIIAPGDDSMYLASSFVWGDPSVIGDGDGSSSSSSSSESSSSSSSSVSNSIEVPDLSWSQWGEIMTAIVGMFAVVSVIRFVRKTL